MSGEFGDHSRWKQSELAYIRFLKVDATLSEQEKKDASFVHAIISEFICQQTVHYHKPGILRLSSLCHPKRRCVLYYHWSQESLHSEENWERRILSSSRRCIHARK